MGRKAWLTWLSLLSLMNDCITIQQEKRTFFLWKGDSLYFGHTVLCYNYLHDLDPNGTQLQSAIVRLDRPPRQEDEDVSTRLSTMIATSRGT